MTDPKLTPHMARNIEIWPVSRLVPYDRNSRTHTDAQVAQVAASIIEFGFTNPILVDGTNGIIAGHCRLRAAQLLKLTEVPVIPLDHLSEAQKRAYIIADNKLAELAGWDEEMLKLELGELRNEEFNLELIGFSQEEIDDLLDLGEEGGKAGLTDDDDAPDVAENPVSQPGDLWILGNHRLMCGDSVVLTDVERLMGGAKADLVFTDPPYNVDYTGYTKEKLKIQSDKMTTEEFVAFLQGTFASYRVLIKPGASMYVCHPSSFQREFQNALESAGFSVRAQIIWAKNTFAWGFGRYKFQHEPIFYCHVEGESDAWYGDKTQSTLWQEKKPAANRLHPTMKPVELIERALRNSSKAGDRVVDLFGGSGSTMIACEKTGRESSLMELDPKYADVIVKRWQDFTGRQAVHEETGLSFEAEAAERGRDLVAA
jgi:DNA modification methylase